VTRCQGSVEGGERLEPVKFLVIWELDLARLGTGVMHAVMRMPDYAQDVIEEGKLEARYHIVGKHGGAWIYDVDSNEELERLLAVSPVYNFARYDVYPLAEMETPADILREQEEG
jgi:muconolactone delta-isomerase